MHSLLSDSSLVLNTHLILFARAENMSLFREKNLHSRVSPFHPVISPFSNDESKTALNQNARVPQTAPWVSSHFLGKLGILVLQKLCFWFSLVPSMPKCIVKRASHDPLVYFVADTLWSFGMDCIHCYY